MGSEEKTFDEQINSLFEEIFDNSRVTERPSLLEQKLKVVKEKKYIDTFLGRIASKSDLENNELLSLIPTWYRNDVGKYFTIPDAPGFRTLLFEVCINFDYKSLTKYYTCEPIIGSQSISEDNSQSETTYCIDNPHEDGNPIILLHFGNNEAFINMGILDGDFVKISLHPSNICFCKLCIDDTDKPSLSSLAYDRSSMDDQMECHDNTIRTHSDKEWWTADIDENVAIIVDPETARLVKRELYYDESAQEWKARIQLQKCKRYFAWKIDGGRTALSNTEIAKCYKMGLCNFPKNINKAAEYYEKDGSADSLYEIAVLFRSEESILDDDAYHEYLQMAIDAGCEAARIEFAINKFFELPDTSVAEIKSTLETVKEKAGLSNFILGYVFEMQTDIKSAFDYYFCAASHGFKPACARLGIKEVKPDSDRLRLAFQKSVKDTSVADYCMGSILFFGFDILPQKDRGLDLLKKSASNGCWRAAECLQYIFEDDPKYENQKESLD